ncbi:MULTISPECIES: SRPBCC domain-containing protein [unclassified Sphingobacterium]|uniref:SRPBCC domain-containing protein n=1 Tax=unclassified Sphingobacterium TaxID=2609468 RepID=UPI00265CAC78|nr:MULTISPECIES: SRPBCC domain-containing protein [unclassified Sphingobacterium]WKK58512.1 SRPBCC domain-containing protein [Sphingobacterium sp. BN32]
MKNFKKYYIIPASPEELYRALTTEITIRLWTGDLVTIDPTVGGEFSLWDGAIEGKFIALEPFSKIVQQWYFGEQEEPSIVTLKLHEHKKGTSFEVNHVNIPDEAYDDIVAGWTETYVESLLEFYEDEDEDTSSRH